MCKMFYVLAKAVNVWVRFQNLQKAKSPVGHVYPQQNVRYIEDLPSQMGIQYEYIHIQDKMNIFILNSPTGAENSLLLAP